MKKSLLCLTGFLFLLSCIEDEKPANTTSLKKNIEIKNNTKSLQNPLASFNEVETQEFQLNLIKDSLIVGKKGTLIYFNRDNLDVGATNLLTFILEEYYDFKDLVARQISTQTKDGRLLETSGVIRIKVKSDDGSDIKLKKGKNIQVIFPDDRIVNNDIYYGERNKEGIVKWEKDTTLVDTTILDYQFVKTYGIDKYIRIKVPKDSLDYYLELNKSFSIADIAIDSQDTNSSYNPIIDPAKINLQQLKWINIDRLTEPDLLKNVTLSNQKLTDYFSVYILYKELNSFLNYNFLEAKAEITLEKIPIKGKTQLLIVQLTSENELKSQLINLGEKNRYLMKLKKTSIEKLSELLKNSTTRDSI